MIYPDSARKLGWRIWASGWAILLAGKVLLAQVVPQPTEQRLVSTGLAGRAANGVSTAASLSSRGDFVVFESTATDLAPLDTSPVPSIYFYDATRAELELVSFARGAGAPVNANGSCQFPAVSADGELVVFASEATNLVPRDSNGSVSDIYLHSRRTAANTLISVAADGTAANDFSDKAVISASGGVIVFQSQATNLAGAAAPSRVSRLHVFDVARGRLTRIDPAGGVASGDCRNPQVSEDGERIVFESVADNLVANDRNRRSDVFLYDRTTGQIRLLSFNSLGQPGNLDSTNPRISLEGRHVAFDSAATDLIGGDTNGATDVFIHDVATKRTERVSMTAAGGGIRGHSTLGGISGDGRFVSFWSLAALVAADDNGLTDVYVHDRVYQKTFLVSATLGRLEVGSGASLGGELSADGQKIAFQSMATNLNRFDTTTRADIYLATVPQVDLGPFPASNHLFLNVRGDLRQFSLDLVFQDRIAQIRGLPVRAFAIDEYNALWVLGDSALARFQASSLAPAEQDGPFLDGVKVDGSPVHALVAAGGHAWAAIGTRIFRYSANEETLSAPLSRPGEGVRSVSLALDSLGSLWACVRMDTRHTLIRFHRDLRQLASYANVGGEPFDVIAASPDGGLFARSPSALTKISRHGAPLWTQTTRGGGGLAVDGDGSVFTVTTADVLGFHADGRVFLQLDNVRGLGAGGGKVFVAVDGRGDVHVGEEGLPFVERLTPGLRGQVARVFPVGGALGTIAGSDFTGFSTANIHAPGADADADGFLNRDETRSHFNPFDPSSPSRAKRLPPVLELTATPLAGRRVQLDWLSSVPFTQFYVYRNRQPIPGSPFPFAAAIAGVIDSNVPAGVHVYRVIGQGFTGRGGGEEGNGGGLDISDDIAEPYSFSQEATISQGDGAVLVSVLTPSPPDAVAHDASAQEVYAVLAGGVLWRLDAQLNLLEESALTPADPLANNEIRGLAVDSQAAGAPLYLLLGDGRVFRRVGGGPATPLVTLNGAGLPLPQGFSGLTLTSGNDNDLFTTMAGPGVDCLIGFFRNSGGYKVEDNVSGLIDTPLQYALGVSGTGSGTSFLAGVGIDLNGLPPSINRVVKLDLAASFALTDSGASVSLAALASNDISGFDFIAGKGLLVADRAGSRLAIVEASFAGSLEVIEVTPPRGRWDGQAQNVQIKGTGFGANAAELQVKLGGLGIPIKSLANGVITVDLPRIDAALEATLEVASATAADYLFPGFTYGFQRGDANNDGALALSDAVFILTYLFSGGTAPACLDAADADDKENIELTDAVYILNFLFLGTVPRPPVPFDQLGVDPDGDLLPCGE